MAEQSLDRLHEQAEKHLLRHVELARANPAAFEIDAFVEFRKNLIGELTGPRHQEAPACLQATVFGAMATDADA